MLNSFALSGSLADVRPPTGAYTLTSVIPARPSGWIPVPANLATTRGRLFNTTGHRSHGSEVVAENLQLSGDRFSVQKGSSTPDHHSLEGSDVRAWTQRVVQVPRRTEKPRVILIAGPTAVGKTRLSIELAKSLGGEIINADSVQVYQGLDVGAAKATMKERQGIPHHLMDLVLPTREYTYEQFFVHARATTEQILSRGLVPIVIGGTGMYMRWFMHNKADVTSHPFQGEDLTGEFDDQATWDYDFQAYFLYQHRADLFPRVDIRCEQMIPALLEETSWLLDLGVRPNTNTASASIGYEEAMALLLEARSHGGVVTEERFLEFLKLFMHNSKGLVKKQIAWFRKDTRSDVRQFRWIQAGQPMDQMVAALVNEYRRPFGEPTELPSGADIKAASMREQKRLKLYKPVIHMYSDPELVARALRWIKATQGGLTY